MKRCTRFCHEDGRISVALDDEAPPVSCESLRGMKAGESFTVWCDDFRELTNLRSIACQEIQRNPRRDVTSYRTASMKHLNGYVVEITASKV